MDADLVGLPLRLTVGERSLRRGGVELKHRAGRDRVIVPLEEAAARVQAEIAGLEEAIAREVTRVPFVG